MAKQKQDIDLSYIHEQLRSLAVPINSLVPDPANPKEHGEENIEAIKASLRKFGQDQPLVVQKQGRIVRKGNGRMTAAIQLGWTHIAALFCDEDEITAIERALADNRSAQLGGWNNPILRQVMEQLAERGDGTLIGWSADAVESILGIKTGPTEFAEVGEDIDVDHVCPKCGYKFSGGKTVPAAKTTDESSGGAAEFVDGAEQ